MKKIDKLLILSLVLVVLGFAACEKQQEVADPISPDGYPVATITPDFTGTEVYEGDTISYTITLDKPITFDIPFEIQIDEASTVEDAPADERFIDVAIVEDLATVAAYNTEAVIQFVVTDDWVPEDADEAVSFEVGCFTIGQRYLLNPDEPKSISQSFTVKNVNPDSLLSIMFSWDDELADLDIVTWDNTYTVADSILEKGDGGATASNPEFDYSIMLSDSIGTYFVSVMPWDSVFSYDFEFKIGFPDQTFQTFTGTITSDDLIFLSKDVWEAWGTPGYDSYKMLRVRNLGTSFTVEALW